MTRFNRAAVAFLLVLPLFLAAAPQAAAGSARVACVPNAVTDYSGYLPTNIPNVTFTNLPIASVSASTLAGFDTVLLLRQDWGTVLSAQQKADINQFAFNGGKLIIYDTEIEPAVNYSWLVYPFTTDNPGAPGATGGVLTILPQNEFFSSNPSSPSYIDTDYLCTNTDAVGDAIVTITHDSHWVGDLQATNVNDVTGWVHMHAHYGSGLIIYNGLDLDFVEYGDGGWMEKIWQLELSPAVAQPPDQPTNLSPADQATGVSLAPTLIASAFSSPNSNATMAASEWQIRASDGSYTWPLWSTRNPGSATSVAVQAGLLKQDATYYWHVCYRDNDGLWSSWSDETSFHTRDSNSSLAWRYVTPATGTTTDLFTFRVLYTSDANLAPDSVMIALWRWGGVSWYRMAELQPGDVVYTDGKWYTYSCYFDEGSFAFRVAAQVAGKWVYGPQPPGCYDPGPTVAAAVPVVLSSGYVTPTFGTTSTDFTWRVKYWNTSNLPADEVWCAVWSGSGKQSHWYRMWALDPADTTYRDGKWYTLHMRWLDTSTHAFRFAARQGTNWVYWPSPPGTYQMGPTVNP